MCIPGIIMKETALYVLLRNELQDELLSGKAGSEQHV